MRQLPQANRAAGPDRRQGRGSLLGGNLARRLIAEGEDVWLAVKPGSDLWRLAAIEDQAQWLDLDIQECGVSRAGRRGSATTVGDASRRARRLLVADGSVGGSPTNVLGTLQLLRHRARAGVERCVDAGTSSEYGFRDHAPREERPRNRTATRGSEGRGRRLLRVLRGARADFRRSPCGSTPAYGPWEEPKRLIPTLVRAGLRGELPPLVNPDVARDFVYMEDVCEAFALAASAHLPEQDACTTSPAEHKTTLRELVDLARSLLGMTAQPGWGLDGGARLGYDHLGGRSEQDQLTAWDALPRVSLEEGLGGLGKAMAAR